MSDGYAPARLAYRELRSAIGPWAKASGYRRWPGTQAGWQKPVAGGQDLLFKFEGSSFASPDMGNDLDGLIQLEPSGSRGSSILRQSGFSRCLVQAELDELARIQGAINRRRPPLPSDLKKEYAEDSLLGHGLRELYERAPQYREGHMLSLNYYCLQDVRKLATFVVGVLPRALDRFLEGRIASPVERTPAHLWPKWSTNLRKPGSE